MKEASEALRLSDKDCPVDGILQLDRRDAGGIDSGYSADCRSRKNRKQSHRDEKLTLCSRWLLKKQVKLLWLLLSLTWHAIHTAFKPSSTRFIRTSSGYSVKR